MSAQNSATKPQGSYLDFLPALYRDDQFMGQFLLLFEGTLKPIEHTVDNIPTFFDPMMTPDSLLPWLASWLDLTLNPKWSEETRRELVKHAAELYRWRGTKRGLSEYIRICTGCTPEISEHIPGMTLGPDTRLGINTRIGSSGEGFHFTVNLDLKDNGEVDMDTVRTIIESQKPAYTTYTLQITQGGR